MTLYRRHAEATFYRIGSLCEAIQRYVDLSLRGIDAILPYSVCRDSVKIITNQQRRQLCVRGTLRLENDERKVDAEKVGTLATVRLSQSDTLDVH